MAHAAPALRRRHEEVVQKDGPGRHVRVVTRAEESVAHHRAIELGDQRREGGRGTEAVGENPLGRERPAVDPDVVVEVVGHFRQDRGLGGERPAHPDGGHGGIMRGRRGLSIRGTLRSEPMERSFPIVRHPTPGTRTPVLVSVPHYGTQPLPHITRDDYREPSFETFAYGFADAFVGDLYSDLYMDGATVLATPFSRMFVDVNRRRDDFEHQDGEVRSRRGVVRTHTMRDVPIFRQPLGLSDLEERLRALYDPYYAALERLLDELHRAHGHVLLLDGHTGSPRRMKDHEVIIGTRHDTTCAPQLAATVAEIFTRHGFEVHQNVSGYTGGNIVATCGQPQTRRVHALQLEINASLLMTTTRDEFIALVSRGEIPEKAEENIARIRQCLREVLAALPSVLATVHES